MTDELLGLSILDDPSVHISCMSTRAPAMRLRLVLLEGLL
jgi:hypothetical protein